jgi:hypothetical protein
MGFVVVAPISSAPMSLTDQDASVPYAKADVKR